MKNPDKLKLKQIKYFSYGMDYFDNGEEYWYLQTASDGYCDYSIIESKNKYKVTFQDVENQLSESSNAICSLLTELNGNEYDEKGISELNKLLRGE